jgi:hypothetical protein
MERRDIDRKNRQYRKLKGWRSIEHIRLDKGVVYFILVVLHIFIINSW